MNRRAFLAGSLAAGAGVVLGAPAVLAHDLRGWPSDRLRFGVVGVGTRGQQLMAEILRVPGAEVSALCDVYEPHLAAGRRITAAATPAFTDYREMLERVDLDAVIVATPPAHHEEHAVAALERGCHVYGEKTMAFTVEGADRIVETADRTGRHFQVGHQYRFAPWVLEAMRRVHAGEIGPITHLVTYWHRNNDWRRPLPANPPPGWTPESLERLINWRMYLNSSRGLLAELGSHHIDFANWAMKSMPDSVVGTGSIVAYPDGRETFDNVQVVFNYPEGRRLSFSSILNNQKLGYQIWMLGTAGSLKLTFDDATFYYENADAAARAADYDAVPTTPTTYARDPATAAEGWKVQVENPSGNETLAALTSFVESLRRNERPFVDARVGWASAVPVVFAHEAVHSDGHRNFAGQVSRFHANTF